VCTLSYIPKLNAGFILTSNRDESVLRKPALLPKLYTQNGIQVVYPKDTEANGTWIATAENYITLCLLNGAFAKHEHKPPYKHSRGLVILDFFNWNNSLSFFQLYDFKNIEPFTLVVIDSNQQSIIEIRWDGMAKHFTELSFYNPHIWSSATLYEPPVIQARQKWFDEFIVQNTDPDLNAMLSFHHFGGDNNPHHRFLMNRNNTLQTISISAIKMCETQQVFYYEDMLTNLSNSIEINYSIL